MKKQGSKFYAHLESILIYNDQQNCNLIQTAVSDVQARHQANAALRESEEKYRLLVENANDAIFIVQEGRVEFANQMGKQMGNDLGLELDRIPFANYIHSNDRDLVLERHKRRIKGKSCRMPMNSDWSAMTIR